MKLMNFPFSGSVRLLLGGWLSLAVALCAQAADNAALVSVSVASNAPMAPRTIFTETWTVLNTGTTTWTPGSGGFTLNINSRDCLGASQLYNNTSSHRFTPSAVINGGSSVPPGVQASFTMSFVAPIMAGTYTDIFQLNNAAGTFFGPQLPVQIVVQPGGNTHQYDRAKAVSLANNYATYVCRDGYFWTNGSSYYYYGTNANTPTNLIGDDCAHFVSSCIGSYASEPGGGLYIPTRVSPTYGEPAAGRLVNTCLIAPGYAKEVFSLSEMLPGDVVGWNWEGNPDIGSLDHVTFYLGNGLLASHAASALDVSANTWYQSGQSGAVRHLVHIFDAPTVTTSISGSNLVLSWGTNWAGYVLQAASDVAPGAVWTNVTTTVHKIGALCYVTNSMPGVCQIYRLTHP